MKFSSKSILNSNNGIENQVFYIAEKKTFFRTDAHCIIAVKDTTLLKNAIHFNLDRDFCISVKFIEMIESADSVSSLECNDEGIYANFFTHSFLFPYLKVYKKDADKIFNSIDISGKNDIIGNFNNIYTTTDNLYFNNYYIKKCSSLLGKYSKDLSTKLIIRGSVLLMKSINENVFAVILGIIR